MAIFQIDKKFNSTIKKISLNPGIYIFRGLDNKILYIGKAKVLRNRLKSYFQNQKELEPKTIQMLSNAQNLETIETDSEIEALLLEAEMIKRYLPKYNVQMRDDKNYLWLGISIGEEYPRVFYARRPQNFADRNNLYFGPYISSYQLKKALGILRKIFPYRTCGKIPHKPDLWYQMYRLPAPCDRSMPAEDYRKIINQLIIFLRGGKKKIIQNFSKEMKKAVKKKNFEQAAILRDKIRALNHLHEIAISTAPEKGADTIPNRIECYDISNISGTSAVGSMIVFTQGEPDKSQYRRFKLKTVFTANDIAMLAEVLKRRFFRVGEKDSWPLPDLIIIDGGAGQLNIGRKIILEETHLNIPIIAIAKGPTRKGEKLIFAGKRVMNNLKLIKQIRDEAHRFAIAYHRKLHAKKIFE
jgi:excinuclease ABC subunit C